MKIELSRDNFDLLLLALGAAVGAFARRGDQALAQRVVQLANEVNKNNPDWSPYECKPQS